MIPINSHCTIRRPKSAIVIAGLFAATAAFGYQAAPGQLPPVPEARASKSIAIDLQDAIRRARAYSPKFQTAAANARIARESRVQARDGLLPTVDALNQFIYTEGNGTPSGVFVANDGVHVYNEQAIVRENLFSIFRRGRYNQAQATEAVALAQKEIAARGLVYTVVRDYYNLVAAQRKIGNARQLLRDAKRFVSISQKQESAGNVSSVDVVKAQLQLETRSRGLKTAKLIADQARLTLAVLLFPDFNRNFTPVDDLSTLPPLPSWDAVQALALQRSPEIQSAQASVKEMHSAATVARYGYLPALALTFYYGIDANQLTIRSGPTAAVNRSNLPNYLVPYRQNLGYSAEATLDIPVWNWGATRSKVRQADDRYHLAAVQLSFAQRQLRANLRSLYRQAETARDQVNSLLRSRNLAAKNVRLTLLRYQAGDATALAVVSAQDSSALALNAYDNGLFQYHVALANLQTLTGSL